MTKLQVRFLSRALQLTVASLLISCLCLQATPTKRRRHLAATPVHRALAVTPRQNVQGPPRMIGAPKTFCRGVTARALCTGVAARCRLRLVGVACKQRQEISRDATVSWSARDRKRTCNLVIC